MTSRGTNSHELIRNIIVVVAIYALTALLAVLVSPMLISAAAVASAFALAFGFPTLKRVPPDQRGILIVKAVAVLLLPLSLLMLDPRSDTLRALPNLWPFAILYVSGITAASTLDGRFLRAFNIGSILIFAQLFLGVVVASLSPI